MTVRTDIISEWVDLLRTDTYPQGQTSLRWDGHDGVAYYCCLGVLCEVGVQLGMVERSGNSYRAIVEGGEPDRWSDAVLPKAFADRLGLDQDPFVENHRLSTLNDDGATFAELADMIEGELLHGHPTN